MQGRPTQHVQFQGAYVYTSGRSFGAAAVQSSPPDGRTAATPRHATLATCSCRTRARSSEAPSAGPSSVAGQTLIFWVWFRRSIILLATLASISVPGTRSTLASPPTPTSRTCSIASTKTWLDTPDSKANFRAGLRFRLGGEVARLMVPASVVFFVAPAPCRQSKAGDRACLNYLNMN